MNHSGRAAQGPAASGIIASRDYRPPDPEAPVPQLFVEVDRPFGEVWRFLVEGFGATDKEQTVGLMTFPFGSVEDMTKYADCGRLDRRQFKGPFLDYLREVSEGQFRGRIDLRVGKTVEGRSKISLHARYTVSASSKNVDGFTPQTYSWAFASGGSATVRARRWVSGGKWVFRTCRPTYAAEREILDVIAAH
jgi:hypothetical protein